MKYKNFSLKIKKSILEIAYLSQCSHLGGNLSVVDILVVLYQRFIKKNKNLILSTGSVYKECSKLLKNNYDWATIPMWGMKFKDQQLKNLKKYNEVVTVENHLQDGGFGSWLSECLTKKK